MDVSQAVSEEEREKLIDQLMTVLNSGSDEECSICLDSLRRAVITSCAHVYCRPCIEAVIDNEQVFYFIATPWYSDQDLFVYKVYFSPSREIKYGFTVVVLPA